MEIKAQTVSLPIDSIEIIPGENPRLNFEGLFELEDSMGKVGQIDDVIVHRTNDKNILLGGECRIRAAQKIGLKFIMAKVFENLDVLTELRLSSGNNSHKPLNALEQARDYQRYIDRLGWGTKQIAAEFKVTKETVERRLKLLQLPDDIQKMICRETNPLPVHQALMLVKLPEAKQREAARKIAPSTGPVMGEAEAKKLLDEQYGDPKLDIDESDPADKMPTLPGPKKKSSLLPAVPKPSKSKKKTYSPEIELTICGRFDMEMAVTGVLGFELADVFLKIANGKEITIRDEELAVNLIKGEKSKIMTSITEAFKKAINTSKPKVSKKKK